MTILEVIHQCVAVPSYRACLAGRHVIRLSNSGMMMEESKAPGTYARLSVQDVLAQTWQVYTEEQLMNLAAAGELGEAAMPAIQNGR